MDYIFVILLIIWAFSVALSTNVYMENDLCPTGRRLIIALCPILNTIFAIKNLFLGESFLIDDDEEDYYC